jgi:hypothetical protein
MRESQVSFLRQMGFATEEADEQLYSQLYSALMLQPRAVAATVALGIVTQSPLLFFGLSAVLLWSGLVPTRNPFDAFYNHAVAQRRGFPPVPASRAPRRFAMSMAGTVALTIGIALSAGAITTAWFFEGLFAVAAVQVVFADVCGAANVFNLVRRRYSNAMLRSGRLVRHG